MISSKSAESAFLWLDGSRLHFSCSFAINCKEMNTRSILTWAERLRLFLFPCLPSIWLIDFLISICTNVLDSYVYGQFIFSVLGFFHKKTFGTTYKYCIESVCSVEFRMNWTCSESVLTWCILDILGSGTHVFSHESFQSCKLTLWQKSGNMTEGLQEGTKRPQQPAV